MVLRCGIPLIRKSRRLREDQDAHLSGALEDFRHVLTSRAVAIGGVGPWCKGVTKGDGGGGDIGVAMGEVVRVGFGRWAEVGA